MNSSDKNQPTNSVDNFPELPKHYVELPKVYGALTRTTLQDQVNASLLLENGIILRYSDKRRVFEKGKVTTLEAENKWRQEAKIDQIGLEKIKNLIQEFELSAYEETTPEYSTTIIDFITKPKRQIVVETQSNTPRSYNLYSKLNQITSLHIIYKGVPLTQEEE